jgi:hypothetical protein
LAANPSKTSISRLIAWVVAGAVVVLETIFDAFKIEVDVKAAAAQVGNALWYQRQILAFQYGDSLVYANDVYKYATIDTTKKIVKRCAIEERGDSSIRIKVAKMNGTTLTALDNTEITALISYVQKVRFAGTRFQVFSNNGDVLVLGMMVYYDPIRPLSILQPLVEAAINGYIQNLDFNGELLLSKITDAVQAIDGVDDVVLHGAQSKFSANDAYTPISRKRIAVGGYFKISTASGETLADTVEYHTI